MLKKSLFIILALLVLNGCESASKVSQTETPQPSGRPVSSVTTLPSTSPTSTPSPKAATVDSIKTQLKIGQSKDEVQKLIGNNYKELKGDEGGITWRYDFAQNNYSFESKGLADDVDLDGLKKGLMLQQFFIYWDKDTLNGYVLYFKNKEGKVEEYRVLNDGKENSKTFD